MDTGFVEQGGFTPPVAWRGFPLSTSGILAVTSDVHLFRSATNDLLQLNLSFQHGFTWAETWAKIYRFRRPIIQISWRFQWENHRNWWENRCPKSWSTRWVLQKAARGIGWNPFFSGRISSPFLWIYIYIYTLYMICICICMCICIYIYT